MKEGAFAGNKNLSFGYEMESLTDKEQDFQTFLERTCLNAPFFSFWLLLSKTILFLFFLFLCLEKKKKSYYFEK